MAEAPKRRPARLVNRDGTKVVKSRANNIVSIGNRLNTIEGSTSDLSKRIDQLVEVLSKSLEQDSSVKQAFVGPSSVVDSTQDERIARPNKQIFDSLHDLVSADDSKTSPQNSSDMQCHTFSTISLFRHARAQAFRYFRDPKSRRSNSSLAKLSSGSSCSEPSLVVPESPPPLDIQRQDNLFPLPTPYRNQTVEITYESVGLPRRSLLETVLDSYLENVSFDTALFCKETLFNAIETQYSLDNSCVDKSWALCFNCILLQSLELKSKLVRSGSNFGNVSNGDLEISILEALKRIVLKLDECFQPRMIDVQALLSLSLVARDYFHFSEFEKVFDRACHIAKVLGLQERSTSNQNSSYQESERRDLVRTLYIVDKQRVFVKGPPCHIYLFECHITLPRSDSQDPRQELELAHLQLVFLLEEVYKHLYSASAKMQDSASQQEVVLRLFKKLDDWNSRSRGRFETGDHGGSSSDHFILHQKLTYMFHVMRILVVRCALGKDSKRLCLENARAALEIIQTLCTGTCLLNGGLLAVERLLRNNSIVAYFEVFENLVVGSGTKQKEDLALLSTATNALGLLSHPKRADSYLNRLHKRLMWCIQIAVIICNRPISAAPGDGSSPKTLELTDSTASEYVVSTVECRQRGSLASAPQNASYASRRTSTENMLVNSETQSEHLTFKTSPSALDNALNSSWTEMPSPGQDLPVALSSEYYIMNGAFLDSTMSSLNDSMSGIDDCFLPRASPMFFGDDPDSSYFYQKPTHQQQFDIPSDMEGSFVVR